MRSKIFCGSAHCRGGHSWIHTDTNPRLDAINCGATENRSPEELRESNKKIFTLDDGKLVFREPQKKDLTN